MAQPARYASLLLSWRGCGGDGHWCNFLQLNLKRDSLAKGGVYVIWSEEATGARKTTVYVGQGKPVADCLARHRDEATITRHQKDGRTAGRRTAVAAPVVAARPGVGGQDAPGLAARSPTHRPSGGPSSRSPAKRPSRRYPTRSAGTCSSVTPGTTARAARPSCATAWSPAVRRSGSARKIFPWAPC